MYFGVANVLVRYLFTLGVMFGFYNPTGRSFVHWAMHDPAPTSVKFFLGCVMVTTFMVLGGATIRSLGYPGLTVLIVLLVTVGGTLVDLGFIDPSSRTQIVVALQGLVGTGLAVGLCWSAVRARLCGQVDSDDVSRRI